MASVERQNRRRRRLRDKIRNLDHTFKVVLGEARWKDRSAGRQAKLDRDCIDIKRPHHVNWREGPGGAIFSFVDFMIEPRRNKLAKYMKY